MRVICWLSSNSLIDWFHFSFGDVWCNLWAVFIISRGHRLVIFILELHFLCPEATMLGKCYITKQLRNRICQQNLTCHTLYLGAFVTCGWDTSSGFLSAITQNHDSCKSGASCKQVSYFPLSHTLSVLCWSLLKMSVTTLDFSEPAVGRTPPLSVHLPLSPPAFAEKCSWIVSPQSYQAQRQCFLRQGLLSGNPPFYMPIDACLPWASEGDLRWVYLVYT